jgi:hypothetical protein
LANAKVEKERTPISAKNFMCISITLSKNFNERHSMPCALISNLFVL